MKPLFRTTLIISILCMALSLSGCKKLYDAFMEGFKSGGNAPKVLISSDGKWEITVTSSWITSIPLNKDALMQASNLIGAKYLVVIQEDKNSLGKVMTLNSYLDLIRTNMKGKLENPTTTDPLSITVNGKKGKLFEITGTYEKIDVHYLIAIIESKEKFHQLVVWTEKDKFEKEKDDLRKIIDSYREL
jgi:hypothetical protein